MSSFSGLGLAEPILRAVAAEGYTQPTPIQAQVIPHASQGRDVLGLAQTGTGKTAAFVLPLLHRISAAASAAPGSGPARPQPPRMPKSCRALILAPTRELAQQIHQSIQTYGKFSRLSSALVVGGARALPQIKSLAPGVDILVATPGRLQDHLNARHVRLDQTQMVVLDEADQMMDLGFLPAIEALLARLPSKRQTILLSATMPREIRGLVDRFLTDPVHVECAQESRPVEKIEQSLLMVDPGKKPETIIDLLADDAIEQAIVFTRTKHGADKLEKLVRSYGHQSVSIHGDKSQPQRDRALNAFRQRKVRVLVATDVAARGIDIDSVSHVFNYDLPNVPEAYVHRIGRTGRAGRAGTAISLCEPSEIGLALQIERLTGTRLLPEGVRMKRTGAPKRGRAPQGKSAGQARRPHASASPGAGVRVPAPGGSRPNRSLRKDNKH
ncbi:MAG: hypothetical protein RL617_1083 [Pseudomonadota bacterium]